MHPDAASDKLWLGCRGATLLLGWIAATVLCVLSFRSLFWFTGQQGTMSNWIEYAHIAAAIFFLLFSGWLLLVRGSAKAPNEPGRRFGVPEGVLLGVSIAPAALPFVFTRNFWGTSIACLTAQLNGDYCGPYGPPGPNDFPPIFLWTLGLLLAPVIYLTYLRRRGLCATALRVIASFFLFYASLPVAAYLSFHVYPKFFGGYVAIREGIVIPFMYAALAVMVRLRA